MKLKIVYIASDDARDVTCWSGTGYHIVESLKKFADIIYVDKLTKKVSLVSKIKHILYKYVFKGKNYLYDRELYYSRNLADEIHSRLPDDYDMIVCLGTIPAAYIKSDKPIIIFTDASFASLVNFYSRFSNLISDTLNNGNFLDKKAFENASLIITSSDWAAKGITRAYGINYNKIGILPYGANIKIDWDNSFIENKILERDQVTCRLFLLGIDWVRKGGDAAVRVATLLNNKGIKTELHVAGIKDLGSYNLPSFVIDHGYLSKNNKADVEKLYEIFFSSHFLILPSLAECTAIVFNEACAFGLPVLTSNVGGSSSIIKNNVNGHVFNLDDDEGYAEFVLKYFSDFNKYISLCNTSFKEYKTRLNWTSISNELENILVRMNSSEIKV